MSLPDKQGSQSSQEIKNTSTPSEAVRNTLSGMRDRVHASVENIHLSLVTALMKDVGLEGEMIPEAPEFKDNERWVALRKSGDFHAVMKAEQAGFTQREARRFLVYIAYHQIKTGYLSNAYRLLLNTKIASPDMCKSVGMASVAQWFASKKSCPPESEIGVQFTRGTDIYAIAMEHAAQLPPQEIIPPVEDLDDDNEEQPPLPIVDISPDISMREMWNAIDEALSPGDYDFLESELVDQVRWCSTYLLVDSRHMEISVREFCEMEHPFEGGPGKIDLQFLQDCLPVRFTK
jgi:hypothetical protein